MTRSGGYREDLAHVHDDGFGALAEAAAAEAIGLLDGRDGLVVDLGCGSGLTARRLADAGHDVLGIDLSPAMVELARSRAPAATFRVGSWASEPLPPCAAVLAVGEVLGYEFDPGGDLRAVFRRVRDALEPGGFFLFDLAGPGRAARSGHTLGDDWAVLVDASKAGGTLTRRITTFREDGGGYRRADEVHRLRLHRPSDVLRLLRRSGFRARALRGYGGERFVAGLHTFLARR